ncbi:MAG: hypothetical protein KDK70_25445 [Myxococcales bacterium]|nr:hypothetical protein [Myxococcales bacterium]
MRAWPWLLAGVAACGPEPADGECTPRSDRSALSDGFQVPRLELSLEGEELSLRPAPEAVYTTCAAFRCPPCFRRDGQARADRELHAPQWEIGNFDACVVGYEHFVGEQPRFVPSELRERPDPAQCEAPEAPTEALEAAREVALWVGCWVYGPTGIIAATALHPLELDPPLSPSCAARGGGPSREPAAGCRLADEQGVGVCDEGRCQPVCALEPPP